MGRFIFAAAWLVVWVMLPWQAALGDSTGETDTHPDGGEASEEAVPEAEQRREQNRAYLARIVEILEEGFFDREMFQQRWPDILERHREAIEGATDQRELHQALRVALGEFGISHIGIIPEYVWDEYVEAEFENRLTLRAGVVLERIDGKFFALGVSGPARTAGLLRGDEVLTVYGVPVAECVHVYDAGSDYGIPQNPRFVIRAFEGEPVELTYRRQAAGKPREASFEPVIGNDIASTRNSVRIFEEDGVRIGYVHTVHFMHMEIGRIVYQAMLDEFAECDALIIDLRGSGGSPNVIRMLLAPFYSQEERQRRQLTRTPYWGRPFVALIDGNARSAKDVYAHVLRRDNLGTLVGRPTAGAVIGASFPALPDGARLIVPQVHGARYTRDRVDLEGNPVEPHIHVPGTLKYARGHDEILAAGRKAALHKVRTQQASLAPAARASQTSATARLEQANLHRLPWPPAYGKAKRAPRRLSVVPQRSH